MLIGIEAERANIEQTTGVEHYARQLIMALAEIDHENEYILYLRTKPCQWILDLPKNFKHKVIPFPFFWTQIRISWEMIFHKPDVLFIMASALPLVHPDKSVVTIHDLAWQFYPETFSFLMRNYLKFSTWFACKFAARIIAVSEQTKKDLIAKYKIFPEKVSVIYHGFDFANEISSSDAPEQEKISQLPEKFILYLGTLQPRKNILGLIDAFIELKEEKKIAHSLVLVGGKGWLYGEIVKRIEKHPEVIYLGYIKDRFAVLKKASLLVQPAFYEGFGLQILDAFYCNVPVAASNISSLPEVAGDAAVYFNPNSKAEMKDSIYKALTDDSLRSELVARGAARLKQFSWKQTAAKTLKVLS